MGKKNFGWAIFGLTAAICSGAHATTAEDVAEGFHKAVVTYCALSVAFDKPLSGWPPSLIDGLSPTTDTHASELLQAEPGDTIWDVTQAKGSLFVLQKPSGDCRVMGFGIQPQPIFDATAAGMTSGAYRSQKMDSPPGIDGVDMWLAVQLNGQSLIVHMNGVEAGSRVGQFPLYLIGGFVQKDPGAPQTQPTPKP